jgi:hypothetical protein
MKRPSKVLLAPERLWEIASDPARVEALHSLVGDFCHLLRNRLNSLQMSLYLARRDDTSEGPEVWDELEHQYKAAEGVVELFQTICRPMSLTPITIGLGLIVGEFSARWAPRFAAKGVAFSAGSCEADGPSWVDPSRVGQGLEALASWRLDQAEAGSGVHLRGSVSRGLSRIEWSESPAPAIARHGELPLAALARVASAHGGSMSQDDHDGWRLRLEWPTGGKVAMA